MLHILLEVGGESFVVPSDLVVELEDFTGATRVPGAATHVRGLVQVRGRVLPLIDLRVRFGYDAIEAPVGARIVVVRLEERSVGLLADRVREVVKLPPDGFRPPPASIANQTAGYVDAVAELQQRLVMRIDIKKVVGEKPMPEEQHHGSQEQ